MPIIIIVVLSIAIIAFLYNSLVARKNQIENAEGSLNACLKQRADLIPNLVEIAKQFMDHEEKTLAKIIELRNQANSCHDLSSSIQIDQKLNQEIKKFMVNVEQYPQLLSNNNFIKIQEALIDVENNISAARRFYNTAIVQYNQALEMFPTNIMASFMKLMPKEIYSIPESEKESPNIKKLFKE